MIMDIQADLKWIQQELESVKDPTLLDAIKNILQYRKRYEPQSIEDYNNDIELAEQDIKEGRIYNQNQIEQLRAQWKKEI